MQYVEMQHLVRNAQRAIEIICHISLIVDLFLFPGMHIVQCPGMHMVDIGR